MQKMSPYLVWIMVAFGLCLGLVVLPSDSFAQTDKSPREKVREADDDEDDEKLTEAERREVKLSLEEARKIALEKIPGTVIAEELEKEHGRLHYAFDIRTSEGELYDVEISAVTGEVFQAELDDDDDDDASAQRSKVKPAKKQKSVAKTSKPVKPKKTF